jgi:hypothetical protein
MSEMVSDRRLIDPSEALKAEFRRTVEACFVREPLDPKIIVLVDESGHSAHIETEESDSENPGKRILVDVSYFLDLNGKLSKDSEGESLGARLARTIKGNTVNPLPDERQLEIQAYRAATGCTEGEAILALVNERLMTPAGTLAAARLIEYCRVKDEQEAFGLNAVDAFELAQVIRKVHNNFPIFL